MSNENIKSLIKEIIEKRKEAFSTQIIADELTTRNITAYKNTITKILKELGYSFDKSSKTWKCKKEKSLELPETIKVFTPHIITYIFNGTKLEKMDHHFLGVFYKKEDAEAHLRLQIDFYAKIAKTITDNNPEAKFNISVHLYEMDAHKSDKGFIFATEFMGENK